MTIPSSRAELEELFRADDRVQAEHRQFMAQPEAQARALVQRNDDGGAPAEPECDWSGWQAWLDGHLNILREELLDGIAEGVVQLLDKERASFDRKLAELRAENAELKGMIGIVLRLYAGETKADVLDLPDWRKRDVAA